MVNEIFQSFDRSKVLTPTPEQKAEDLEQQKANEERLSPLVSDSLVLRLYNGAVIIEENARLTIRNAFEQMAESYFWQGRFSHAAETTEDPAKKNEYERFAEAFENRHQPVCSCPPRQMRVPGSAKAVEVPARRDVEQVYVGELKAEVKFIQCDSCGKLFSQSV